MVAFQFLLQAVLFYGGLVFWPWLRLRGGVSPRCLRTLRLIFVLHLFLHFASLVLVAYCHKVSAEDWPKCLLATYLVGIISAFASMIVIVTDTGEDKRLES